MNKVVHVFLDSDMRCQHDGLEAIARKKKVRLETLSSGEHVLFVNGKRNRVKMYSPGGVLSYLKLRRGRLDMSAIAKIPQSFGENIELKYRASLKKTLEKRLGH